jgi:hypothetical protein
MPAKTHASTRDVIIKTIPVKACFQTVLLSVGTEKMQIAYKCCSILRALKPTANIT